MSSRMSLYGLRLRFLDLHSLIFSPIAMGGVWKGPLHLAQVLLFGDSLRVVNVR